MDIQVGPLSERAMSSFALSIGTALAFESLFPKGDRAPYDPLRPIPQHIDVKKYDEVWVNLGTLIRNIYQSVPSNVQAGLMAVDLYVTLESEVDIIRSLVTDGSLGRTKVVFYTTDDKRLKARHPHAKLKIDTTDKQRAYTALSELVLAEFHKRHSHIPGVMTYHEKLTPPHHKKALILTHDAYDLLSWQMFADLHLLESHTGLLKKRPQWYTKYHSGVDLMRIPFNSCFMQVFGDSIHFHPFPMKDRMAVRTLADERAWTYLSTKDRLVYSFQQLSDPILAQLLLEMLNE
jgi:hypothetical protein